MGGVWYVEKEGETNLEDHSTNCGSCFQEATGFDSLFI